MRTRLAIKSIVVGLGLTLVLIALLMVTSPAHGEEFDAAEVIREAEIGTYSRDYYEYDEESTTEDSEAVYEASKSETIYIDGKAVCFKLESGVSVAYYCDN